MGLPILSRSTHRMERCWVAPQLRSHVSGTRFFPTKCNPLRTVVHSEGVMLRCRGYRTLFFVSWLPRVRRVSAPQNKRFGFEKNCECNRTNNIMALQLLPCSTHRMQTSWPTKCTPHRSTADPQGVMLRRRRCRTYLMFPCKYHDNQRLCTSNHDSTVFFLRQNEGDARRIVLPKHQTNGNLKRKHDCMVAG